MTGLIDRFLVHKEVSEGCSVCTSNKYRRFLLKLDDFLGDTSLEHADKGVLIEFTGMYAHKTMKLTPSARRPIVAAVRTFYSWLFSEGIIEKNSAMSIPYPKIGRPLPVAMQLSSAEKILMQPDLDTFAGVRDLAILSILIGCGPRVSGVCKLNDSDLIFYTENDMDQLAIRFVEKGGRERVLPAPMDTLLMLRAYLGHHEHDNIDRNIDDGDKVLFVSMRNRKVPAHEYNGESRRITSRSVDRMIKAYGEAAGIPTDQLSAHAFRHLFGAELAEDDVSTLIIQAMLGHADPKTSEIYSHLALRKLRQVSSRSNPLSKIKSPVSALRDLLGKSLS